MGEVKDQGYCDHTEASPEGPPGDDRRCGLAVRAAELRDAQRTHAPLLLGRCLPHQMFIAIEIKGRLKIAVGDLRKSLAAPLHANVFLHFVVVPFEFLLGKRPVGSVAVDRRRLEIELRQAKELPAPRGAFGRLEFSTARTSPTACRKV